MGRMNSLSDGKNTLKEMTHGNLKKIYKMQAKSCRNIFRVYHNQDNFSTELEPRKKVMSQTSFGHISINSSMILIDNSHGLNGTQKPLKRSFDRY